MKIVAKKEVYDNLLNIKFKIQRDMWMNDKQELTGQMLEKEVTKWISFK